MLDKEGQRQLCYVVRVDNIEPILGKDRVESATVNGWHVMVPKGQFKVGDLGIYFEIDSKVDTSKPEFAFTEKYHGKIKTQKFSIKDANGNKIGQFWSQGLLMSFKDFGWVDDKYNEGDFLTKELGVTYAEEEDNIRKKKTNENAKYQKMMNRHPKLAKSRFGKWCMKHNLTKKLLYLILGNNKKDNKKFPEWVKVTDEERYQNISSEIYTAYCNEPFWATEKIDGASGTFCMKRKGRKYDYYVCSRTVVKDLKEKTGGYYNENIWAEVNEKYNLEAVCADILKTHPDLEFITLQGEVYGKKVQKREYNLEDRDLAIFNVILGYKDGTKERLNPPTGKNFMDKYGVPLSLS